MVLLDKLDFDYTYKQSILLANSRADLIIRASEIAYHNAIFRKVREGCVNGTLSKSVIQAFEKMEDIPGGIYLFGKERNLLFMEGDKIIEESWKKLLEGIG